MEKYLLLTFAMLSFSVSTLLYFFNNALNKRLALYSLYSRHPYDYVVFDITNSKTHPEEGTEVLCYIKLWERYTVAHMYYEDNGDVVWRDGEGQFHKEHYPLVWKHIDYDHIKT